MRRPITTVAVFCFAIALPTVIQAQEESPTGIRLRIEAWQMPNLSALKTLDEARNGSDSTEIVQRLRKDAGDDVRLLTLPSVISLSGHRTRVQAGAKEFVESYVADKEGKTEIPRMGTYIDGSEFEVDVVLRPDGKVMDINLAFQYAFGPATLRDTTIIGPVTGRELQTQIVEQNLGEVVSTVMILDGQTKLIGTIPNREKDATILVFLFAEVITDPVPKP